MLAQAAFAQTASDTVSFVNFENRSVGVYGNAEAKEDFKRNSTDGSWWYAMEKNNGENSKIVYDGEEHGNGDKNGRVQTWFDGELALDVDTLRLRDYDTVHVDKFYLSTFHGGSSTEWAPTHDCFIRYDNFTVSTAAESGRRRRITK